MKTEASESNKSAHSSTFNSRLAAYSATATAALLVVPVVADAQIVNITGFTQNGTSIAAPDITLSVNNANASHKSIQFDAGVFQNTLAGTHLSAGQAGSRPNGFKFLQGNLFGYHNRAGSQGTNLVNNFVKSAIIPGSHNPFGAHVIEPFTQRGFFGTSNAKSIIGYAGFKVIKGSNKTYYGWLRLKVDFASSSGGKATEVSLVAKQNDPGVYGAYALKGSVNGVNIGAGVVATPEPSVATLGGLALLACGAAGVRELRRRRQQPETIKAE